MTWRPLLTRLCLQAVLTLSLTSQVITSLSVVIPPEAEPYTLHAQFLVSFFGSAQEGASSNGRTGCYYET